MSNQPKKRALSEREKRIATQAYWLGYNDGDEPFNGNVSPKDLYEYCLKAAKGRRKKNA